MKHYNIRVRGRVQGVGFRYAAQRMAKACGISGFVRNDPDGSVRLEAEGEEPGISAFLEWCRKGPDFGRVDDCQVVESGIRGFEAFSIQH